MEWSAVHNPESYKEWGVGRRGFKDIRIPPKFKVREYFLNFYCSQKYYIGATSEQLFTDKKTQDTLTINGIGKNQIFSQSHILA